MDGVLLVLTALLLIATTVAASFAVYQLMQNKKNKEVFDQELKIALQKGREMATLTEEQAIEKASAIAKKRLLEAEKKALQLESKAQDKARTVREKIKELKKILD